MHDALLADGDAKARQAREDAATIQEDEEEEGEDAEAKD
jgi:hypothetical protein